MENDSAVPISPISNGGGGIHDEPSYDYVSSKSTIADLEAKLARLTDDNTHLQARIKSFDSVMSRAASLEGDVVHLQEELISATSSLDDSTEERHRFKIENLALESKVKELEENVAAYEKKVAELDASIVGLKKQVIEKEETTRQQVRYLEEKLEIAAKELEGKDLEISLAAAVSASDVEALQRSIEEDVVDVMEDEQVGSNYLPYAVTAVSAGTVAAAITMLCMRTRA